MPLLIRKPGQPDALYYEPDDGEPVLLPVNEFYLRYPIDDDEEESENEVLDEENFEEENLKEEYLRQLAIKNLAEVKTPPVSAKVAIPKELLQVFAPSELKSDNYETSETEEIIFQKVLKKKMSCDSCMSNIKRFRCSTCFYAMCQECTIKVVQEEPIRTPCPHCREPHYKFLAIILPKL